MIIATKKQRLYSFKTSCFDIIKKNKIKCIILFVFSLIAFFTGIIVAVKTRSISSISGILGSEEELLVSSFGKRFLSMAIVFLVVFVSSFSQWLLPIAVVFLSYRAYLLGLNLVLLIVFHGFSGSIVALLIALPCQILVFAILLASYLLMCSLESFGNGSLSCKKGKIAILFFSLSVLLLACALESLLIYCFSPTIILVF